MGGGAGAVLGVHSRRRARHGCQNHLESTQILPQPLSTIPFARTPVTSTSGSILPPRALSSRALCRFVDDTGKSAGSFRCIVQ